jgi:class 3 adenylate cyclase
LDKTPVYGFCRRRGRRAVSRARSRGRPIFISGRTLARLRALRSDLIDPTIALHHGRIVKRTEGSITEFRSVVNAVRCAIEVQQGLIERNAGVGFVTLPFKERERRLLHGPSTL